MSNLLFLILYPSPWGPARQLWQQLTLLVIWKLVSLRIVKRLQRVHTNEEGYLFENGKDCEIGPENQRIRIA